MMQANWSAYDESPTAQKENSEPAGDLRENGPNHRIRLGGDGTGRPKAGFSSKDAAENGPNHRIKLGGDGMGNPKGGRGWSLGDDSDDEKQPAPIPPKKGAPQKAGSSFWDF